MLEISGTFLGAAHSVFLQRKVKSSTRALSTMGKCKVDLKIVLKYYVTTSAKLAMEAERAHNGPEGSSNNTLTSKRKNQNQTPQPSVQLFTGAANLELTGVNISVYHHTDQRYMNDEIDDQQERLERLQDWVQEIKRLQEGEAKIIGAIEHIVKEAQKQLEAQKQQELSSGEDGNRPDANDSHRKLVVRMPTQFDLDGLRQTVTLPTLPIFGFGNIPLASMGSGVACLAISTIILSATARDLKPEVWITSTVVLATVIGLSFFPFRFISFHLVEVCSAETDGFLHYLVLVRDWRRSTNLGKSRQEIELPVAAGGAGMLMLVVRVVCQSCNAP